MKKYFHANHVLCCDFGNPRNIANKASDERIEGFFCVTPKPAKFCQPDEENIDDLHSHAWLAVIVRQPLSLPKRTPRLPIPLPPCPKRKCPTILPKLGAAKGNDC